MIKIDFEFETQYGIYRDALYVPEDNQFTATEIEDMKQQRLGVWLNAVETMSQEIIGV